MVKTRDQGRTSALVWLPAEVTLVCWHGQAVPVVAWRDQQGRVHVQARPCILCGPVRHRQAFGRTLLYIGGGRCGPGAGGRPPEKGKAPPRAAK